ncbi:hypothetical protein HK405_003479, partial [Cladochytrium tenue]
MRHRAQHSSNADEDALDFDGGVGGSKEASAAAADPAGETSAARFDSLLADADGLADLISVLRGRGLLPDSARRAKSRTSGGRSPHTTAQSGKLSSFTSQATVDPLCFNCLSQVQCS